MSATLGRRMATPRWYLTVCAIVPFVGWLPMFAFPPMIHGGTLAEVIVSWVGVAGGGYGALEIARDPERRSVRALAWFGVALYGAMLALGLGFAVQWLLVYA
jgi:hypothetical protein